MAAINQSIKSTHYGPSILEISISLHMAIHRTEYKIEGNIIPPSTITLGHLSAHHEDFVFPFFSASQSQLA